MCKLNWNWVPLKVSSWSYTKPEIFPLQVAIVAFGLALFSFFFDIKGCFGAICIVKVLYELSWTELGVWKLARTGWQIFFNFFFK